MIFIGSYILLIMEVVYNAFFVRTNNYDFRCFSKVTYVSLLTIRVIILYVDILFMQICHLPITTTTSTIYRISMFHPVAFCI